MPNLNTINKNTDDGRHKRSENVSYKHVTTLISQNKKFIRGYVFQTWTDSNKKYETIIKNKLPSDWDLQHGNKKAVVSCSCEDFKYRWEYALKQSDNSVIKHSNGQPAVITNPTNVKGCCKHIIKIMPVAFKKNDEDVQKLKQYWEKKSN